MISFRYAQRRVLRYIHRNRMFKSGERVAVGVSGGKDSNLLLYLLSSLRSSFRDGFDLAAFRIIDPASPCYTTEEIKQHESWTASMGINYYKIIPDHGGDQSYDTCFACAWRRREHLFKAAHARGYPILALGHTAFDLAVTALINLYYHGKLETMPPRMLFFNQTMTLIRPISCLSEQEVIHFNRREGLPDPVDSCNQSIGATRARVEEQLRSMIAVNRAALPNILKGSEFWAESLDSESSGN